jgi:hypothetical protein
MMEQENELLIDDLREKEMGSVEVETTTVKFP